MEAMKRDGEALEFVPTHFKDEEMCRVAYESNISAMKHFPRTFWDEYAELRSDGSVFWNPPEWVERARAEKPQIEEWIPENVLAYSNIIDRKPIEAPKELLNEEEPAIQASSLRSMLRIHNSAATAEGRALAPDRKANIPFGGRNFTSIESAFKATIKAFPAMAKNELKLLSTLYLKASTADETVKNALVSLGEREIAPDLSYADKKKHPVGPFLIAAAIDRVRAHYGIKTPPIPYSLEASPFASPYKPGYLYSKKEASRRYERWLSANIKARMSKQGMEDIARIVALASSGTKICIHSQFSETAKVFAKTVGALCEKTKTAMDLEAAIGEPCPPEAAYVRHKSAQEAKAEKLSERAFKAHPRSRVVKFIPETYIIAMPSTRIFGTEKISLDELKALVAERKDWNLKFGIAPLPSKIVFDIDGRLLPGAREVSFESVKPYMKFARPILQYDGAKLKRPMEADSLDEMARRAKNYLNARLLVWDAKTIDSAILVIDGSEARKAEQLSFDELQREATKNTSFFVCANGGSPRRAVRGLDDFNKELRLHPNASLYAFKSLAPQLLRDFNEFEQLSKAMPDAELLRRPASIRAYAINEERSADKDGKSNRMAKLRSLISVLRNAGVTDLTKASDDLIERIQSNTLEGLTASEARHVADKLARLNHIKDFHSYAMKNDVIAPKRVCIAERMLERFGIDAGDEFCQGKIRESRLFKELGLALEDLDRPGFHLHGSELRAAKSIINLLKEDAIMQVKDNSKNEDMRENYNDSLDLETEHSVTMRVPKERLDSVLKANPFLSEKGEEDEMAILEGSYLIPDRDALTEDDVDDELEEQYYGADLIRALDMPISQIEKEARKVFSISDPFSPEPSLITALEESESLEEFQERHDYEDREPCVEASFIHFDDPTPSSHKHKMRR